MKISAKIDYACRAILELSLHWPNKEPLPISAIAEKQEVPMQFLTQILINLKQLGLVESVRGQKGGYLLATSPLNIKVSVVVQSMGSMTDSHEAGSAIMDEVWDEVDQAVLKTLENITFDILVNRYKNQKKRVMFHI